MGDSVRAGEVKNRGGMYRFCLSKRLMGCEDFC